MLIVNADDWGHTTKVTDAIVDCFEAGLVSSTTAMVWMRDSSRAADIARERRLPVGLHLNLTAEFEGRDIPQRVRERQRRVLGLFSRDAWRETSPPAVDPVAVRDAVQDQLDRFREEFGEPTHIDGHHHIHVHPAVLAMLPPELPIRSVPRPPGAMDAPWDERDRAVHEGFAAPDITLELHRLHPALGGAGLEPLARARSQTIELVTHPYADRAALESDAWRELVASLRLGSYRDLERPPVNRSAVASSSPVAARRPCAMCGSTDRVDYHDRPDAVCASCGSLERQRALGRVLDAHRPRRQTPRCLEVGPRNAWVFGGWLRARGWEYEAVDRWDLRGQADPDALGDYIDHDADLSDLHFAPGGHYDLFLLQHVLEEVLDYRSALDEISRIIRGGGVAYLEIPWQPGRPDTTTKSPDRYNNVWSFGADLLDELHARFSRVDVLRLGEDRYVGDYFACWRD